MIGHNMNYFSFIEPLGHDCPQTKLERYWASFWGPFSLKRERTFAYAQNSNMTFCPIKCCLQKFDTNYDMPSDDWILKSFISLVRNEFSTTDQIGTPCLSDEKINKVIYVNESFLEEFALSSENFRDIVSTLSGDGSPESVADNIFDLLCDPRVGDKKNRANNNKEEFKKRIVPEIESNRNRILFVIPGFPFKDQNRFRVPYGASSPDLAEVAFMLRLYRLTQAIYQVHPFGVDVIVLTDGELYKSVFNINSDEVELYRKRLIHYRNKLNLQATVSFISLKDLFDRANDNGKIDELIAYVSNKLDHYITSEPHNSNFAMAFDIIKQAMKWNYNSKPASLNLDDNTCWQCLRSSASTIPPSIITDWNNVDYIARKMAVQYAAVNLVLKYTDLIHSFFPDAIRGTVHPKPNQFALAGSVSYAWNGVAWCRSWPNNIDDVKVVPFFELCNEKTLNKVILESSNEPLFYTSTEPRKNYFLAQRAFPLQSYKFLDFVIRPFKETDFDELKTLGKGDINFSWERIPQQEDYYRKILNFRINHYNDHKFGVYGIWYNDHLIGQVGLQVLSIDDDQIEWVVFLGKDYVGKKIGTSIIQYVISLCKQSGIDTLFAIVRQDNPAGIALAKKVGGIPCNKKVNHYSKEGIKFKFDLTRVI